MGQGRHEEAEGMKTWIRRPILSIFCTVIKQSKAWGITVNCTVIFERILRDGERYGAIEAGGADKMYLSCLQNIKVNGNHVESFTGTQGLLGHRQNQFFL